MTTSRGTVRYAVAVLFIDTDGTLTLTVAGTFKLRERAELLALKVQRQIDAQLYDIDRTVFVERLVRGSVHALLNGED